MHPLLAPVFAQVAIIFALTFVTGQARLRDATSRKVRLADVALSGNGWPTATRKLGNCLNNQFQFPMLFFALVLFVMAAGAPADALVPLAWVFIGLRMVHAAIFVTSNNMRYRFYAFLAGLVTLAIMWAVFAWQMLSGAPPQ